MCLLAWGKSVCLSVCLSLCRLYFGPHISVNAGLPLATLEGGSPWKVRPLEVPRLSLLQQLKQMRDVLTQNRPKFSQPVEGESRGEGEGVEGRGERKEVQVFVV